MILGENLGRILEESLRQKRRLERLSKSLPEASKEIRPKVFGHRLLELFKGTL